MPRGFPKEAYEVARGGFLLELLKKYSAGELFADKSKAYWEVHAESRNDKYWKSAPFGLFRMMLVEPLSHFEAAMQSLSM